MLASFASCVFTFSFASLKKLTGSSFLVFLPIYSVTNLFLLSFYSRSIWLRKISYTLWQKSPKIIKSTIPNSKKSKSHKNFVLFYARDRPLDSNWSLITKVSPNSRTFAIKTIKHLPEELPLIVKLFTIISTGVKKFFTYSFILNSILSVLF